MHSPSQSAGSEGGMSEKGRGRAAQGPMGTGRAFTPVQCEPWGVLSRGVTRAQKHSSGGAEKSSDSGCILKSQPKSWVRDIRERKQSRITPIFFGLSNWPDRVF